MQKFLVASMFMWILPVAILYGFNNDLLPGKEEEGPSSNASGLTFFVVDVLLLLPVVVRTSLFS